VGGMAAKPPENLPRLVPSRPGRVTPYAGNDLWIESLELRRGQRSDGSALAGYKTVRRNTRNVFFCRDRSPGLVRDSPVFGSSGQRTEPRDRCMTRPEWNGRVALRLFFPPRPDADAGPFSNQQPTASCAPSANVDGFHSFLRSPCHHARPSSSTGRGQFKSLEG